MCSCVRSDHKAVLINCNDVNGDNNKRNVANDCICVTVFDLNPNTLNTLSDELLSYNWSPVAKCHPVVDARDFRPISVTSLLCRLLQKILIKTYITPALAKLQLNDHYAYKPTGSTTGALVDFTHKVSMLLETHDYVRCVLIDFSKACLLYTSPSPRD